LFVFVAWSSADWLAQEISASDYEDLWCEPLRGGVIFLMNQPGGVKLNPQLSDALGAVFLYLIDSWTVVTAGNTARHTRHTRHTWHTRHTHTRHDIHDTQRHDTCIC
jgi:hypothetical protein